ncbi:MAG: PaaI family thioesterase [Deltaproteobacteria bacterium]|nr:PaaI family thioesterase [Deltaproteobacteria bacterium]
MDSVAFLQETTKGLFPEVLGIQFLEAAPERVKASLIVRPELCTTNRIVHGGAIMAFADTLGAYVTALNLDLSKGVGTATLESKTNFLAAAPEGSTVFGECTAVHRGKRTMVWQTRVTREDGTVVAVVTQTQMVLEPRLSPQETMAKLFEGKSLAEQQALMAALERGGAALYRSWAAHETQPDPQAALLAAATREEDNAVLLEKQNS